MTPTAPTSPLPVTTPCLTAEEFAIRHAGDHVELVKGVVQEIPVAGLEHGAVCQNMAGFLWLYARETESGRVMSNDSFVKTGPESVRGADVLFYSYERLPKSEAVPKGFHSTAPDLVVEVKSPSDRWSELFAKVGEYLKVGVRVVVVVDPGTTSASVYRDNEFPQIFHNGDELTLPDVLPGFAVKVSRLFA